MAPYLRGSRYPLLSPEEIKYLLRDEFSTDLPAGSVNGTLSDSGHVRTVVDSASHLSIATGKLTVDGGAGWGDPLLTYGTVTRMAGKIITMQFNNGFTNKDSYPLLYGTTGSGLYGWRFRATGALSIWSIGDGDVIQVNIYSANTDYKLFLVLRATGCYYLSSISGINILQYASRLDSTASEVLAVKNLNSVFTSSFLRIPQALWLPVPLLSTSGAMTWPTTNGLGHAEGVAGGLGAGGSGLTLLDAGTWAADGSYLTNTPVAGEELIADPGFDAAGSWNAGAGWAIVGGKAARTDGGSSSGLAANSGTAPVVGQWYLLAANWEGVTGAIGMGISALYTYYGAGTSLRTHVQRATTTVRFGLYALTVSNGNIDNASVKPLPISTLITNVALATTDVLAEQIIHAYTLGSQVGWVQSDRPFAAKAAATAAAGQAVISLKEVTGVGGVGLAVTDTITVGGVTYTIASVTGGANVAYNDTLKTQTVTLGANLGAEVLADAKVGLDWVAWNGSLTYFDGSGNIKLNEVLAGVYTNRGSTATTFSANKRLIVRKIGSEYQVFYNEALVGSAISTVAAGAMAGTYFGIFSTSSDNQVTSMVIYDTGNVSNSHSVLDRYSKEN